MRITDNGKGLDQSQATRAPSSGLGLRNMPPSAVELGRKDGLPQLPAGGIVMLRASNAVQSADILDGIAEAFRTAGNP